MYPYNKIAPSMYAQQFLQVHSEDRNDRETVENGFI